MKTNKQRRIAFTLGAAAGGLLATALLPVAVAYADDFDVNPDTTSFVPTQVEGYPPLENVVTGTENWDPYDLTSQSNPFGAGISGVDTETTIGSFTNDDFLDTQGTFSLINGTDVVVFTNDTQIDLANFGGGFANEWIDIPSGPDAGTADLLITPFGDVSLFGSFFSDLAAVGTGFI